MKTIVLVLKASKDFTMTDVELICKHINNKWASANKPKIICMFDKAQEALDFGNFELIPLPSNWPGTWSRIALYSPAMEQYRPFLYVDLDTAIIKSIENIFDLVTDETQYITLEDFYQKNQLATGLVWFPANSKKVKDVWNNREQARIGSRRMDIFIRQVIGQPDMYWQRMTDSIIDFKPQSRKLLEYVPDNANVVCFHGAPRIRQANINWVRRYVGDADIGC